MTCNDVHYAAVVDLMFDIASQDIFSDVTVYDSMEVPPPSQQSAQSSRTLRCHLQEEGTPHQLSPTSPGCLLLRDFQKFMQTTCFCQHPNVHKLLADDSYILCKVKVGHCPQQRNYLLRLQSVWYCSRSTPCYYWCTSASNCVPTDGHHHAT